MDINRTPPNYDGQPNYNNVPPNFGEQQNYNNVPPNFGEQQNYNNVPPNFGEQQNYNNVPPNFGGQQNFNSVPPNFGGQQNFNTPPNFGWQSNYDYKPRRSRPGVSPERFEIFGGFAFGYAMIYSVLMYRNYASICAVFMAVMTVLFMSFSIMRHEKNLPVNDGESLSFGKLFGKQTKLIPHYAGILLLGVSVCRTDDSFLIVLDHLCILFLVCAGLLRYFDDLKNMGFVEYGLTVIEKMAEPFTCFDRFFSDYRQYNREHENARKRAKFVYILIGVVVAIPLLFVMISLLSSADQIFGDAVETLLGNIFLSWDAIWFLVFAFAALLFTYGIIVSAPFGSRHHRQTKEGTHEPIIAITAMGLLTLVYLLFSVIQILYLFTNNMSLPDDMTYAEYARQGFFQLMFVSVLNVILVLICHAIFSKSTVLNIVLTIMSACTYVMIASAVYRMMLYVQQYHLTFLRVLVLWFLAMLVVLMAGVVLLIFNRAFPLFRFCLVAISVFYLGFAWIKPDYVIARYNVEHGACQGEEGLGYFAALSSDAAPAVAGLKDLEKRDELLRRYARIYDYVDNGAMGLRTCNFSALKARKLWVQVQE